ncbi:MAG: hypothetical protein Q8N08_05670 [Methanobacteriaceae archaeon]|nr:hypothetical protein [Methanobacteriaceae archaeon]
MELKKIIKKLRECQLEGRGFFIYLNPDLSDTEIATSTEEIEIENTNGQVLIREKRPYAGVKALIATFQVEKRGY